MLKSYKLSEDDKAILNRILSELKKIKSKYAFISKSGEVYGMTDKDSSVLYKLKGVESFTFFKDLIGEDILLDAKKFSKLITGMIISFNDNGVYKYLNNEFNASCLLTTKCNNADFFRLINRLIEYRNSIDENSLIYEIKDLKDDIRFAEYFNLTGDNTFLFSIDEIQANVILYSKILSNNKSDSISVKVYSKGVHHVFIFKISKPKNVELEVMLPVLSLKTR